MAKGSAKIYTHLWYQRFQAMTAGPRHDFNDAISIVVTCDSQAELGGSCPRCRTS
jgi:predicted 3-demethylubiquinone-9 3-methyltransferase (glyoxalase superfamily)